MFLFGINSTEALIAYDCGAPQTNISTVSLLEVGECKPPEIKIQEVPTHVQLIEYKDFNEIKVLQCKIEIIREIFECGMFGHISAVHSGLAQYIQETSHTDCLSMHTTKVLNMGGDKIVYGLELNKTIIRSITLAGSAKGGKCSGAYFSDPYGEFEDVVVLSSVKVTLNEYTASVNLDKNTVHMKSGFTCDYKKKTCLDPHGGNTFWESGKKDRCERNRYGVLYDGVIKKIINTETPGKDIVYFLESDSVSFALKMIRFRSYCGYMLAETEHPKLMVFEYRDPKRPFIEVTNTMPAESMDLFTYVNSKFLVVTHNLAVNLRKLYEDVILQQCHLEQRVLRNLASLAHFAPEEFAYNYLKGPGSLAVVAGEVIHLVKCIPTEVLVRHVNECYTELPVSRGNESFFVTPKTHILVKMGTQIFCNPLTPSMYLLDDTWFKLLPRAVESVPPTIMKPNTAPLWKYISPAHIAASGIYTQEDLNRLRDHIMFPQEKMNILNSIARQASGLPAQNQRVSLYNLMDEETLEKIANNTWNKVWNGVMNFGTISAAVIGFSVLARFIKLLIDTIVQCYTLHTVYGWSLHLLGACFGSVTHLLVHLSARESDEEKIKQNNTSKQDRELQPVVYTPVPQRSEDALAKQADALKIMMEANHHFRP